MDTALQEAWVREAEAEIDHVKQFLLYAPAVVIDKVRIDLLNMGFELYFGPSELASVQFAQEGSLEHFKR